MLLQNRVSYTARTNYIGAIMLRLVFISLLLLLGCSNATQQEKEQILPGAYQIHEYSTILKDQKVGLTVNHSSLVGSTHLVDTLINSGINVVKVFTPEHGFKGTASDGVEIDYEEQEESFELISLYGKNKKPADDQMLDIDIMVFDIQDVGTRFFTYISTMHYVMEACAENSIPLVILDRPNPNGSYVEGPILDTALRSFVGMHPIPIVHGMTVGELARMINGENWLANGMQCDLTIIPIKNWSHSTPYSLPIKPSPNLPDDLSIALYPSLCLFEGTIMSVGRGTEKAFQQIGHPEYPDTSYSFTPKSWEGSRWPPYEGEKCYGISWTDQEPEYKLSLRPLISVYQKMNRSDFFNDYFKTLAGTTTLQRQIESGMSEDEIKVTWKNDLDQFKEMRTNYLIYP